MLNIINEELMSYNTMEVKDNKTGKTYTKIRVATSNKLQQYDNDTRVGNKQTNNEKKSVDGRARVVSLVDKLHPVDREIIRISAPLKNIGDFIATPDDSKSVEFDLPMSINVNNTNKYQPTVEVRCHEQGDDRANLYVIAFPFNGMIRPIPENPQYRIYKGLIASSARPFYFNNRRYRKVLYLVVEVNKNLFDPNHKYHTDSIDIQLESYALFDDRETREKKTSCEVFNVSITSPEGDYQTAWNYNVVDEAIMMNAEPGQQLWVTFTFDKNDREHTRSYSSNDQQRNRNRKSQKPMTIEGNTVVTTNKHGIRKEIPLKNGGQRGSRGNRISTRKDSIEEMMMYSGMYDNDHDNRGKRNGGRKNNRSDNRGRDRYRY